MDKEKFIKIMRDFKRVKDELERIEDFKKTTFLEQDFCGTQRLGMSELETLLVDTLEIAMNDKNKWIYYYIYDLDWGKNNNIAETDNKEYKLETTGDLYEVLTNSIKK